MTRLQWAAVLFTAIVSLLLPSCSQGSKVAFNKVDPWYNPPPANSNLAVYNGAVMIPVKPDQESAAIAKLTSDAFILLPHDEASTLASVSISDKLGYYLVRGVVLNEKNGAMSLHINADNRLVCIRHDCLGENPMPMLKRCFLVALPFKPNYLYTDCHMAK